MKIKYLISLLVLIVTFAGCDLILNDSNTIEITITPESSVINIVAGENISFGYTIELKTNTPVTVKKYSIEYFETPNGAAISELNFSDNVTEVYLQKTADKVTIKNLQYVTPSVKNYMTTKSLSSIYAKVHFYYTGSSGDEKEKPASLVEIKGDDKYPEVTAINAYDVNTDGRFDTLVLTINKDLLTSTVTKDTLTKGWEISAGYIFDDISYADKKITIAIKKTDLVKDTAVVPQLLYTKQLGKITDINGKDLNSFTWKSYTIKDKAGPIIASVKKTIGTTSSITVTFSESISNPNSTGITTLDAASIESAFKIIPAVTGNQFPGSTTIMGTGNMASVFTIYGITTNISSYTKLRLINNAIIKDLDGNPAVITGEDITIE